MQRASFSFRFGVLLLALVVTIAMSAPAVAFAASPPCPMSTDMPAGNPNSDSHVAVSPDDQSIPCQQSSMDCLVCVFCVPAMALAHPQLPVSMTLSAIKRSWPIRTNGLGLSLQPAQAAPNSQDRPPVYPFAPTP